MVTVEVLMETSRLEEEQLIERYILNQMNDQEASEFETFFLSNQECIEQLEMAEKLYQGLGLISESMDVKVEVSKMKAASNDAHWWTKKVPAWSLAAMLMIAILPSGLLFQQLQQGDSHQSDGFQSDRPQSDRPQGTISVISFSMSQVRGENEPAIEIKGGDKQVILSTFIDTEVEGFDYPAFGFELKNQNSDEVAFQVSDMQLNNDGMLYVDLGSDYLEPGDYKFSISNISENKEKTMLKSGVLTVTK